MKEQVDNNRGFLKEKMGAYEASPPASVWNGISDRLGGRSRRSVVFFALAAAASLALALSLGIHYFGRELPQAPELTESAAVPQAASPIHSGSEDSLRQHEEVEAVRVARKEVLSVQGRKSEPEEKSGRAEIVHKDAFPPEKDLPAVAWVPDGAAGLQGDPAETTGVEAPEEQTNFRMDPAAAQQILNEQAGLPESGQVVDLAMEKEKDPRWMLGAALSPLYSFRDADEQYIQADQNHESGHLSYAGGIQVAYRTTKRLVLETGVFFNKMGIDIGSPGIQVFSKEMDMAPMYGWEEDRSDIRAISNSVGNIVSASGDVYVNSYMVNASENQMTSDAEIYAPASGMEQEISQHLDYLEIPFNLRYTVLDRAIRLQLVGGLSTNLLVNNYVTMDTPEGRTEIGYMSNVRNVNYSGNAGIGLAYDFSGHFSFSLEPRFRYFLNSVNDQTLPSTRPYTLGIYTGLSYMF